MNNVLWLSALAILLEESRYGGTGGGDVDGGERALGISMGWADVSGMDAVLRGSGGEGEGTILILGIDDDQSTV